MTFKVAGKTPGQIIRFGIPPEAPYQLQQLQDALNLISEALVHLSVQEEEYEFQTAEEVVKVGSFLTFCGG